MSRSSSSLYAMAHGDDRGVVAHRSMNDKRETLIGTATIESCAYSYPHKSMHMPHPINAGLNAMLKSGTPMAHDRVSASLSFKTVADPN